MRTVEVSVSAIEDFSWKEMPWYCCACGKKTIWKIVDTENTCGCVSCGEVFYMSTPDDHGAIYEALRELAKRLGK